MVVVFPSHAEMYCDSEEDTKNNLLAKRRRLENFHFESETEGVNVTVELLCIHLSFLL